MNYNLFPFFVLRSPSLPVSGLLKILDSEQSLLKKLSDEEVQEAIFLASPVLFRELKKLLNGEIPDGSEDAKRLYASLTRYICRMSTRCTPFGLFAGCKTGKIDSLTNLKLSKPTKRKTRLDMLYLYSLYDRLVSDPAIQSRMKFYPNSSIYPVNGNYRYMESVNIGYERKYRLVEVEQSTYLDGVLHAAGKGATMSQLSGIIKNMDIPEDDANEFINDLIASQLLVGQLSQSIVGEDFFKRIIRFVKSTDSNSAYLPRFIEIEHLLKQLDAKNKHIGLYPKIIEKVRQTEVTFEEKFLFQVDMVESSGHLSLGETIANEVKSSLEFLNSITPSLKNNELEQFKNDFYSRYEDREIPLMEALDPDIGLGYPSKSKTGDLSPLVDGFNFPPGVNQTHNVPSNEFHTLLLKKTITCLSENKKEIIFSADDVKHLPAVWDDLPPTMFGIVNILEGDTDDFLLKLSTINGSSAANLLSRFAYTDKRVTKIISEITRKEKELLKDAVTAEIVHLPESRIGNVLSRPHIRDYEILYIASSDIAVNRKIGLTDLLLSVRNGRLMIRSKKLNKEIIPRLTTAHNYMLNPMPIYRFLCDMQIPDGRRAVYFDWGPIGKAFSFRPRVRYKQTIFSPATWVFDIEDLKFMFNTKLQTDQLLTRINEWRRTHRLNRFVLMPDHDNELFVDWENILSIRSLLPIIKNRKNVTFTEFFFEKSLDHKNSGKKRFTNECIVAMYKN